MESADPKRTLVVIPARMDSKRLPGKPLRELRGRPLIAWAWDAACASKADAALIATDSVKVQDWCKAHDVPCYMSTKEHATGTDRVAEAARDFIRARNPKIHAVVNLQCDEPQVTGQDIDELIDEIMTSRMKVATLCYDVIKWPADDPNAVYIVRGFDGLALYFSRKQLPGSAIHVGVYAFHTSALQYFPQHARAPLEEAENLEQLRFLERGVPMQAIMLDGPRRSVNCEEDLEALEQDFPRADPPEPDA